MPRRHLDERRIRILGFQAVVASTFLAICFATVRATSLWMMSPDNPSHTTVRLLKCHQLAEPELAVGTRARRPVPNASHSTSVCTAQLLARIPT